MVTRTLAELAVELGGDVIGDGSIPIRGVAGIREAQPGDVTFIANSRYNPYLHETRASAVICSREPREAVVPLLVVDNPYLAFQRVVRVFRPDLHRPAAGIHPTAVVATDVVLGEGSSIGPHCVVESGTRIGERVVLAAGCYLGYQVAIGDDTILYPHVVVREECVIGSRCIVHPGVVIGADGFGFAFDAGQYHKVPQVGNVVIGDDVEIGANTTIDRATTHSTKVGDGTKIDNLVQIGHNVEIGRHCIIVAQVGISGSTVLEDHVTVGGQAGIIGHVRIGQGSTIGGKSGVSKAVKPGSIVTGYPAAPHGIWKRTMALLPKLPELFRGHRDLEERVGKLEHENEREEVR